MDHRTAFAPARPVACALAIALATSMTTVLAGSAARAQTPPAPAPAEQQPQQQATGEQPQLIISPWTKFCLKGQEAGAKEVCFTSKDGRVESGQPAIAAVSDPKAFEEQQQKLQQELQRRADEARKRLERQQSQPPAELPAR